jgi:hypothetical protein
MRRMRSWEPNHEKYIDSSWVLPTPAKSDTKLDIEYKFISFQLSQEYMNTKSRYRLVIIMVFSTAAMAALSTIGTTVNVYAQNITTPTQTLTPEPPTNQTTDPQQIKNYLNQAIQALDSGNNTRAFELVELAEGQIEIMIGHTEANEEEEETEEGAGEDEDEPGDTDTNDD